MGPQIKTYLPAVLHGGGTQSLTLRGEHIFRVLNSAFVLKQHGMEAYVGGVEVKLDAF
jgi:hypothetical protein